MSECPKCGYEIEDRTPEQNDKLWPMLRDISRQIEWAGKKRTPEQWKDLITAAWKGQESAPGLDGGIVFFGVRTSKLSKRAFSELIECIYATGTEFGVKWSDPALKAYEQYREAA